MADLKVIICDVCKGFGKVERSEITDYHNNDKRYWDELCIHCNGFGRLVIEEHNLNGTVEGAHRVTKFVTRPMVSKDIQWRQ